MRSTSTRRRRAGLIAPTVIVLMAGLLAGCGGSDGSSATTDRATASSIDGAGATDTTTAASTNAPAARDTAASETSTIAPVATAATATTVAATAPTAAPTTASPTTAPATTAAPDALQQRSGVEPINVAVGGADPSRPVFSWNAPPAATDYEVVVQDAAGAPIWAWTGSEASVVLGGTERAADVEGPRLAGTSRVRVYAFDAGHALVGVSAWTAVNV